MSEVLSEIRGGVGMITLQRPQALNALSLGMVRQLTDVLLRWQADPHVLAVAIRGSHKQGPFGHFCAGGDIRFFHQAALAGDPRLEDFFTEEYTLNHLIFSYPKPYLALMDGIVMGGGMGISQGASWRLVTERTQMAMPETQIGLFPDVGGGYFLSRLAGSTGEYLGLTGQVLLGDEAVAVGLADGMTDSHRLPELWEGLARGNWPDGASVQAWLVAQTQQTAKAAEPSWCHAVMHEVFSLSTVSDMFKALQSHTLAEDAFAPWAEQTLQTLLHKSPLMLHVVLAQIRRARGMTLAQDLMMERDMVRHCFWLRPGAASETVEGIRALAVDKDKSPKWHPALLQDVTHAAVDAFFQSPWPDHAHPLRHLAANH